MARYSDITSSQGDLLTQLVTLSEKATRGEFIVFFSNDGAMIQIEVTDGFERLAAPDERTFYASLEDAGYIKSDGRPGTFSFRLLPRAFEFAEYKRKSRFGRWLSDASHTLGDDKTVRAKLFWYGLSAVIGGLAGCGFSLLGRP